MKSLVFTELYNWKKNVNWYFIQFQLKACYLKVIISVRKRSSTEEKI